MTVERGSPKDSPETAIDGLQVSPAGDGAARASRLATLRRWARGGSARWRSIVATVVVLAAVGVAVSLYFTMYRPDRRIDDAAARRAIAAASEGAIDLMSYSYLSLDSDFAKAKSHLTGDFLAYYSKFTEQIVAPAAQQGQLTTTTKVIRAAVSEIHPSSAAVLIFVDQTTVSKQKPQPVKADSSVLVSMTKVNGSWLIAKFDPVA
jgi:Mce-associated membrane protein